MLKILPFLIDNSMHAMLQPRVVSIIIATRCTFKNVFISACVFLTRIRVLTLSGVLVAFFAYVALNLSFLHHKSFSWSYRTFNTELWAIPLQPAQRHAWQKQFPSLNYEWAADLSTVQSTYFTNIPPHWIFKTSLHHSRHSIACSALRSLY